MDPRGCDEPLYPLPAHPPIGPEGPPGPQGPAGPTGPPGPALDIEVAANYAALLDIEQRGLAEQHTLYITSDDGFGYLWVPDGTVFDVGGTPGGYVDQQWDPVTGLPIYPGTGQPIP